MSQFEVRRGVNKTIADVVAWSMDYAASGRYPTRGFYNEEFGDGTYRKSVGGNLVAAGHKFPEIQQEQFFWENHLICISKTLSNMKSRELIRSF